MKKTIVICAFALAFVFGLLMENGLASEKLPRILTMGTMPAGMLVNVQGTGIADICSSYTPMDIKVRAVTSEEVWVPMMNTGEVQIGVSAPMSMRFGFLGTHAYKKIAKAMKVKSFALRMITVGTPIRLGIIVPGNSPIKKMSDLKGKRVGTFSKGVQFRIVNSAIFANAGLNRKDLKEFPVANPLEGVRALLDGNVDAAQLAVDAPIIAEAAAKLGAYWLPLSDSPEAEKRMQGVIETAYPGLCPGGEHIGVPKPTMLMNLDVYFVAHESLSEAAVYALAKALWTHNSELVTKPMLKEWTTDRFVSKRAYIAYHPGAIHFYKEKGVWTKEMDELQKARLAEIP